MFVVLQGQKEYSNDYKLQARTLIALYLAVA